MKDGILQLYSVFDVKVGAFAAPFLARTKGEAVRSFQQACADDGLPFKRNPEDYSLFFVGGWDDDNGRLLPLDKPDRVIGASEF